ncbi:DNA repair protein RadA [Candidatus Uhrbacteria bacterium]|nr:DNA repair protein RadA [Candidatus Uhrbacteria bacterium]
MALSVYICSNCDAQSPKWAGRCLECGSWGTLAQGIADEKTSGKKSTAGIAPADAIPFSQISNEHVPRRSTGIAEVDQVLGGGIVPGSLILLGGEPGIGKSTILGQLACSISQQKNSVIYCSGEESAQQVKMRFDRIKALDPGLRRDDKGSGADTLLFIGETNCEKICGALRHHKPTLAIVDSIQTIASSDIPSEAGSIAQVRACTVKLLEVAKQENIPIIITGHVTKEGGVAGPKTLEHLVDTVLYLEGDASQYFRLLKTVKNRFGSTNEIGVFEMTGAGLVEVKNPSELFLSSENEHAAGTATTAVVEGSRAFLVPIQALTSKTYFGYPQRKSIGIDANRLGLLVAVLSKRLGVNLGDQDIHVNVVGGLRISEPAADLAVCASILSSYKGKMVSGTIFEEMEPDTILPDTILPTIFFGEVGLTGEVRPVSHTEKRLKEAEKLGFKTAYIPKQSKKISTSIQLVEIKNVRELEI